MDRAHRHQVVPYATAAINSLINVLNMWVNKPHNVCAHVARLMDASPSCCKHEPIGFRCHKYILVSSLFIMRHIARVPGAGM